MTGVPVDTLKYWRWRGQGGPPSYKIGRRVAYDESAVRDWLQAQRERAGQPVRSDDSIDERINAWVTRQLEHAPPLTAEQRELLRRLLRPSPSSDVADRHRVA